MKNLPELDSLEEEIEIESHNTESHNNERVIKYSPSIFQHTKAISKKAIPLIVINGSNILSQFIRIYLIADKGDAALEASTIFSIITDFVLVPVPLLTSQDAVFISEKYGKIKARIMPLSELEDLDFSDSLRDSHREIGSFLRQGWLLTALSSLPFAALLILASPFVIPLFNQPDEVSNLADEYILPFSFSLPFQFMLIVSERFVSAVDQEKWLIPYRLITLGFETGLNFWLIPSYSVSGAAYAQIAKSIFAFTGLSIFFAMKSNFRRFQIFKYNLGDISYIKKILSQGFPIMLSQFFIVGVSLTLSVFVGSLGSSRLGISQILSQYFGLLLVINSGIGESANRIISQYFGAGNYREMQRVGNISLLMNAAIYSTVAITYDIFSKPLASVFLDSDTQGEDIEALIRYNFIIMSLGNFFAALQENCRTNLSAVNDTMLSSVVPFITYVAMVLPMAAIATYVLNFDLYGIIGAMSIATFINLSVVGKYWFKHSNQIVAANDDTVVTSNEKTTQFFGNSCHKLKSFFCADKRADTQSSVHTILQISKRNRHPIHKDPESARFTAISENEELDEKQLVV